MRRDTAPPSCVARGLRRTHQELTARTLPARPARTAHGNRHQPGALDPSEPADAAHGHQPGHWRQPGHPATRRALSPSGATSPHLLAWPSTSHARPSSHSRGNTADRRTCFDTARAAASPTTAPQADGISRWPRRRRTDLLPLTAEARSWRHRQLSVAAANPQRSRSAGGQIKNQGGRRLARNSPDPAHHHAPDPSLHPGRLTRQHGRQLQRGLRPDGSRAGDRQAA